MDEVNEIEIKSVPRVDAAVRVPGSKSVTNRVLLLAAMSQGKCEIEGALFADDTRAMVGCLQRLGFNVEPDEVSAKIIVHGLGGKIPAPSADLFVAGAGTVMRFLLGFLTLGDGVYRLDGNARMRQRPIGPLARAIAALGAEVTFEDREGFPPLLIKTRQGSVQGGRCEIDGSVSSQFVSGLLMPAPLWPRGLILTLRGVVARPFVDMTLALMRKWGAKVEEDRWRITVPGLQRYRQISNFQIEPDLSNASYFASAAALCGGRVRLLNVRLRDSVQGDAAFLDLLRQMGAQVIETEDAVEVSGSGQLRGVDVDMSAMPDMVPTLAAIAPCADSPTIIRNVGFIRHHESDRLAALTNELRRLGVRVTEYADGLRIDPSEIRPNCAVETYDDHRIAMSFAVLGLKVGGIRIKNPRCVAKTYPGFFEALAALY